MSRLVYGIHPVEELLRSRGRDVSLVYLAEGETGAAMRNLAEAAKSSRVLVANVARAELDALADGGVHQGVIAVAGEFRYRDPQSLIDEVMSRGEEPLLLVLDSVQDPQNLGALIRSAHVLGAHGVVLPKDRAAHITPSVVKASAGASEHLPIALCTNIVRTLEEMKERGIWVAGAVAGGEARAPWVLDLAGPLAIVLGAEGKGLRPLVLRACDLQVEIPMAGQVASLNVSAAGAVLLYEALRQRRGRRTTDQPAA